MTTGKLTWGQALVDLFKLGTRVATGIQGQVHLRRQVLKSVVLLEPVRTDDQPVPSGWVIVEATPSGIFADAWSAAQVLSPKVLGCSRSGRVSDTPDPEGFVIIPRESALAMWPLFLAQGT